MSHAGERLRRFALSGYILAFVSVGAAFVLSLMLLRLDSPLPFTGFALSAIAITSWRGRTGPGILAALLSELVRSYFFQPATNAVARVLYDSVFLFFALLMIWITRSRNELEVQVAQRTAELTVANEKLKIEIVERKRAEGQSRALIDAIPHQIWSGPPDGTLDYCNDRWRSDTGLGLKELQGDAWQSMLHPDDRERVLKAWRRSVANGTTYEQEERHRGADGTYRWFLARGVPLRDAEGSIVRWYGTYTDIEDRKNTEVDLRRLSGQLLKLQDEERRRIARELHDSTGQDLVALATMLGQLRGLIPSVERKSRRLISECRALADKCIRDIRTLSYVLHPPVLDDAGLGDAIRDYVRGFIKRSGIDVELELSPLLGRMPQDIELALFRVAQESLTNIQRHSGSQRAKIRIDRNSGLTLEVSDLGSGLLAGIQGGQERPQFELGVGISSMEERLRAIGGRLEIDSTSEGTTVSVTVPLGEERM